MCSSVTLFATWLSKCSVPWPSCADAADEARAEVPDTEALEVIIRHWSPVRPEKWKQLSTVTCARKKNLAMQK